MGKWRRFGVNREQTKEVDVLAKLNSALELAVQVTRHWHALACHPRPAQQYKHVQLTLLQGPTLFRWRGGVLDLSLHSNVVLGVHLVLKLRIQPIGRAMESSTREENKKEAILSDKGIYSIPFHSNNRWRQRE